MSGQDVRLRHRIGYWFWRFTEDPKDPPKWATHVVLAQCDDGEFYLPSLKRDEWWDRRFTWRYPAHWPYALLSRCTGWTLMIEPDYSGGES